MNSLSIKKAIAHSFSKKASSYHTQNHIQQMTLQRVCFLLCNTVPQPKNILDLGCGVGSLAQFLPDSWHGIQLVGIDIAIHSLLHAKKINFKNYDFIASDIDHSAIKPLSFECALASSVLQWSQNLIHTLKEIHALLTPKSWFGFSFFLPDNLHRLREQLVRLTIQNPIQCYTLDTILSLCSVADFSPLASDSFQKHYYFQSGIDALKSIHATGAAPRLQKQLTPKELKTLCLELEKFCLTPRGLELTWSVGTIVVQKN